MSRIGKTHWLALGAAVAIAGCASNPTNGSSATAYGELGPESQVNGVWLDSVGGLWMDSVGVIHHGRRGRAAEALSSLSNQNIIAHVAAGDSAEIALSRMGLERATNPDVRAFAQDMVNAHTQHLDMSLRMASQAGIVPTLATLDTLDSRLDMRMNRRLSSMNGADFDKAFMGEEYLMHRHMLSDLKQMRTGATGVAQQLIDQTIPVVKQHFDRAEDVWEKTGGKPHKRGTSAYPGGI